MKVINILTVHWKIDRWLIPQYNYIKSYTPESHRIYLHISPQIPYKGTPSYYHVENSNEKVHSKKLNLLADMACISPTSNDRDLLIFLDGDAFPIKRYIPQMREFLKTHPLIAVQRLENDNEVHPHPSFCCTTVRFWRAIRGTWEVEPQRTTPDHVRLKDTGGRLWGILHDGNYNWKPLHRSNKRNYHPIFFAIYGNLIYHHGGAFFGRIPRTRLDNSVTKETRQPWRKLAETYSPQFYNRLGRDKLFFLPLLGKPHCWTPSGRAKCPGQ